MTDAAGDDLEPFPNGRETAAPGRRARGGRFAPGNPGGPGRPKGARHAALAALDAIGTEAAEEVLRRVVEDAKAGDLRAAEILLRRFWPERQGGRSRSICRRWPPSPTWCPRSRRWSQAMGRGELTPEEAQAMAAPCWRPSDGRSRPPSWSHASPRWRSACRCRRGRAGEARALDARLGRVAERLVRAGGLRFPAGPVEGWPAAELRRLGRMVEAGGAVRRAAWARLSDARPAVGDRLLAQRGGSRGNDYGRRLTVARLLPEAKAVRSM